MSRKIPAYIREQEFNKILSVVPKKHHKLAFILGFHSGLRISEIVKLQKADLDFAGGRINIRQAKGQKDRVVPLPKGFPGAYLALVPIGCSVRALQLAFKRYVIKSGITTPGLHFHSLRHSFAVRCMERGIPLNQIQMLLGHENLQTTSIYLKINPKDALDSYDKMW